MATVRPHAVDIVQIARAADFAAQMHTDQRRKGCRGEPYINHPVEVARLVAEATGGTMPVAVLAALLHDTVEDTDATFEDIEGIFGAEIAAVVAEVTDDKSLPKAERKQLQIDTAAVRSLDARLVKLGDKISNLRSMRDSPPDDWPWERRRAYFDWAKAVVDRIRGTNVVLEALFDDAYAAGVAALDEETR